MPRPILDHRSPALLLAFLALVALAGPSAARLPAQLIPKVLAPAPSDAAPTRPVGDWEGTARETIAGGQNLEYPITLRFLGDDAALQLAVTGNAKVPTADGRQLTVAIKASYRGSFRDGQLRMRSERIEVRVVETGESIPSEPQRVEAALANGVITGRVGSDAEGWTTFTARPSGRPDPRARAANSPGFTGRWRGPCSEPGPDGKELRYPITVQFSGTAGDLRAELAADLRYPTQDGGTTAVEYRATFRGRVENGELRMRSEEVRIGLPEMNRTESAPPQELTGRLEAGVLRARIGGEGPGESLLELRPETGTGSDSQESTNPTERVGDRDPGRSSPYPTLVLERREARDPGLGNVASHTLLVPKGWQFQGGVQWTPTADNFVHFIGALQGPDRESLHFDWNRLFTYSYSQSQLGNFDDNQGQQKPDGSFARKPPRGPGEAAVEVILRKLRPNASGFRVVDSARLPEVEEKVRAVHAVQLGMIEQQIQQMRQNGGAVQTDASTWLVAERTRVRYEEDGTAWEEEVRCTMFGMHASVSSDAMRSENGYWLLSDVRTARAPVGELDDRVATLLMLAGSLRETPRWSAAIAELKLRLAEARTRSMQIDFDEIRKRGEMLARSRAELSDIQMKTWRDQQASQDRVQRATIDSIRGAHDFRAADGEVHTVTNHYDRAFVNPNGNLILTNDPNYRPQGDASVNQVTWDEMQRIDPFRQEGR